MKYHAYLIKVFLFCLMVLVSVQFVLFDKIDACPRYLSEDSPLRLHNLIRSEHYKAPDATRHPHNETDDFEAASACILVCDDNHFLIGTLSNFLDSFIFHFQIGSNNSPLGNFCGFRMDCLSLSCH